MEARRPARALRRPAAARGARPRAGQPPEGAAPRRAARRARPEAPRADAGRAEGAAAASSASPSSSSPTTRARRSRWPTASRSSTRAGSCRSARRATSTSGRRRASSPISSAPPTCSSPDFSAALWRHAGPGPACGRKASDRPARDRHAGWPPARRRAEGTVASRPVPGRRSRASSVDVGGTLDRPSRCPASEPAGQPGERVTLSWRPDGAAPRWRRDERASLTAGGRRAARGGVLRRVSDLLFRRPRLLPRCSCSAPPLLWLGVVYVGSLLALLAQSFFSTRRVHRPDRLRADAGDLRRASHAGQSRHHPPHRAMAALVTLAARRSSPSRSPITPRAMRAAAGRRSSISASCCRSGRAIWCASMPGS